MAALLVRETAGGGVPLRVAVLEPKRPHMPTSDSPIDPRVVAVARSSERIATAAGAWGSISARTVGVPRVSPYERMRIWHESVSPTSPGVLAFDAAGVGEPNLGD